MFWLHILTSSPYLRVYLNHLTFPFYKWWNKLWETASFIQVKVMKQNQPLNLSLRIWTWLLEFRKKGACFFYSLDLLKLSLQLSFYRPLYFSIFMARKLGQTFPPFILFIISKASDKKPCDFSSLLNLDHFSFSELKSRLALDRDQGLSQAEIQLPMIWDFEYMKKRATTTL